MGIMRRNPHEIGELAWLSPAAAQSLTGTRRSVSGPGRRRKVENQEPAQALMPTPTPPLPPVLADPPRGGAATGWGCDCGHACRMLPIPLDA